MVQQTLKKGENGEEEQRSDEYHVISFSWEDFEPVISLFDGEDVIVLNMDDVDDLDISLSRGKTCVGNFEGGYTPCPEGRSVESFRWCPDCALSVIPKRECIFDPDECGGCQGGICEREHVVYLAFFGTVPKVGMTREERSRERMIEQGADAYALLEEVENRWDARDEEKGLSRELGISQRVSAEARLEALSRDGDLWTIERRYEGVSERVPVGELHHLEDYPISTPLRDVPRLRSTHGRHTGEDIGVKGKYLIYENSGLQALDLMDMVGRMVRSRGVEWWKR